MLELEQARTRILDRLTPLGVETVRTSQSQSRHLSHPLSAPINLPPFDNSAMDGYAVISSDLAGASEDHPKTLKLQGRIPAGQGAESPLQPGSCIRIFTGSPLPPNADAVVMQEDTVASADRIAIRDSVKPWENVRFQGEDIRQGTALFAAGHRITAGTIGLLSALGVQTVQVGQRPIVALLATGTELVEPGHGLKPGQIYESNRATLAPLVARAGGIPRIHPIVPDSLELTRRMLEQALKESTVVITTGGVSVGELDFVKQAFTDIGGKTDFWKVAIRPGKPFVFGTWHDRFLFGLPGNPVSAIVTYILLVRPALMRWQGASDLDGPSQSGTLARPIDNPGDRRHFVRVRINPDHTVEPAGTQASHLLSSLAASQGLVDVPPRSTLPVGQLVRVIGWDA